MNTTEAFKELWSKLYNPRSGCPDVSLEYVLISMVGILVDSTKLRDSEIENWAVVMLSILGETTSLDIELAWSNKVPAYVGKTYTDGMQLTTEYDDYYSKIQNEQNNMRNAIEKLLADEIIQEKDGRLSLDYSKLIGLESIKK